MERFRIDELSIEAMDMEDLLKKNEYLDMKDYIEEANQKEMETQRKRAQAEADAKRRRGG